jgi:uncharacterized phage protein gp47/JayE
MALSLAQLLTPKSEDEALAELLTILDGLGFSATSWQDGSIQRTLVQLLARLQSSASNTTLAITKGRFNDLAEGDWLSLLSTSTFDNTRIAAVAAQVKMTLSDPLSVGPTTIVVSQLVAKDQNAATYRNITGGTLAAAGSLELTFEAEVPGIASPSTLTLTTPLAGITAVISPVDPITRPGANAESDPRLQTRNKAKWSTLAYAAPADAYVAWALAASPSVTRAWVDDLNPRGPGTLDLYVAGPSGSVPGGVLTTILSYIEGGVDGIYRRPLGSDLDVLSATSASVSVTGTLYVQTAYSTTVVRDAVYAAITEYMQALPVGGAVKLAKLYDVIMGVQGVNNVHLTAPTADTTVAAGSVPVPGLALSSVIG